MPDGIKRLWLVTVERTTTAKVLAWAESCAAAEDLVHYDCPLDEYGFEGIESTDQWATSAFKPGGSVAEHHMNDGDDVYGDQDGESITVRDAIAIETGDTSALPEHLAALVRHRKESGNGQLPLIP